MAIKIKPNLGKIKAKVTAGTQAMKIAVTESVVEYGNIFVREDQGVLAASALIGTTLPDTVNRTGWSAEDKKNYSSAKGSDPENGKAVWDTPYAKRVYYTGTPSKDKNPDASLMWAQKGVDTYKKELDAVAQNAFEKGLGEVK